MPKKKIKILKIPKWKNIFFDNFLKFSKFCNTFFRYLVGNLNIFWYSSVSGIRHFYNYIDSWEQEPLEELKKGQIAIPVLIIEIIEVLSNIIRNLKIEYAAMVKDTILKAARLYRKCVNFQKLTSEAIQDEGEFSKCCTLEYYVRIVYGIFKIYIIFLAEFFNEFFYRNFKIYIIFLAEFLTNFFIWKILKFT